MTSKVPAVPPKLKAVAHYMKTAAEHDKRDPIIAYWCRLYSLQKAMTIDTKRECKEFLLGMMDYLEQAKKAAKADESLAEAVTTEEVGSAHVENYALEIFRFADDSDRNGRFDKNVIKSFYTAGLLMDVMEVFKDGISPELQDKRKYAKMKALYLNNCMKSGETPIPGPLSFHPEGDAGENESNDASGDPPQHLQPPPHSYPAPPNNYQDPSLPPSNHPAPPPIGFNSAPPRPEAFLPTPPAGFGSAPAPNPSPSAAKVPPPTPTQQWTPQPSNVSLTPDQIQKAQKYSKYATSALQYEDVTTAISNLHKALTLLTTGQDT